MSSVHVCAYYYSEREKEIILEYLKPEAETDSFIFGRLEVSKIPKLRQKNILVDLQQDPSKEVSLKAGDLRPALPGTRSIQLYTLKDIKEKPSEETKFFAIKLPGPLLDIWRKQLTENEIELLNLISPNIYKVKTRNQRSLEKLAFIIEYKPFNIDDKELVLQKSVARNFDPFAPPARIAGIYDIRLHEDADKTKFIGFLNENNIEILEISRRKLRVKLSSEAEMLLIGKQEEVYGLEEFVKPELHNDLARHQLKIDVPQEEAYTSDLKLTGEGEIIGVADTGLDEQHPDISDRINQTTSWGRKGDTSDPNGHGTHVAGSVIGNGKSSNGKIKGMAPGAKLFFQSLLDENGGIGGIPHDLQDLFIEAYEAGVRIHNNSWGSATESEYRFTSLEVDEFVYSHKDMLIVISCGNEGTAFQPRNSNPGFVDWLSLGSPATSKNALSVGASRSGRKNGGFSSLTYGQAWPNKFPKEPIKNAQISGDPEALAGFSSRGPCGNESRIKPDVVAPGTDIVSTKSSLAPSTNFWGPYPKNRKYAFMGGTSMAAPIITGFAALIREYLRKERNWETPSAALLKSIIINSTRPLNSKDALADHNYIPNFHQGFGIVNMLNLLPSLKQEKLKMLFLDTWKQEKLQFTATGQRFLFSFKAKEGLPLRLCLTWTDPPGRGLQNNLNLLLMNVDKNLRWIGNEKIPRMITAFDRDNNVEIIRIEDPHQGEYRLVVQANNLLVSGQDFALSVTGNIENDLEQVH